jgi:tetratricopeptide (TPR) repeat protein
MNRSVNRASQLALLVAVAAMTLATSGCTKLQARDQLNKGVQAYKASRFELAEQNFKNAINLDPSLTVAKLYLATACFSQYVPGSDDPSNVQKANCAIEQYNKVLETDPKNVLSIKGLASLYYNMKKLDEAKQWDHKAIDSDPNDPENYYSAAVIDWLQTYEPRMKARGELGLPTTSTEPLSKHKKVCQEINDKNRDKVEDGIALLNKALELRKDYEDAMSYLNLLYRERADIQCDDDSARTADIAKADDLVNQVMAVKKEKLEKANQKTNGIVLDQPK